MKNLITISFILVITLNAFAQSKLQPNTLQLTYDTSEGETTLIWNTFNEQNSSFFRIERSTDGIHFEAIATVKAIVGANKSNTYAYNTVEDSTAVFRVILVSMEGLTFVSNALPVINGIDNTQKGLATK